MLQTHSNKECLFQKKPPKFTNLFFNNLTQWQYLKPFLRNKNNKKKINNTINTTLNWISNIGNTEVYSPAENARNT